MLSLTELAVLSYNSIIISGKISAVTANLICQLAASHLLCCVATYTETTLYYLQSRYYNPILGRFINADAFASTGQGILGNNMFAYCLNNPIAHSDSSGTAAISASHSYTSLDNLNSGVGAGSGTTTAGGGLILVPGIGNLGKNVMASVASVYREFTQSIKESQLIPPGSFPITHHIVPYGKYSTRNSYVRQQLAHAQSIMKNAGVDPEHNLMNQVVISASYHLSLHSNDYILMVTTPIIALGENPAKDEIYEVLYYLRIGITANDPYAYGY